MATFLRTFSHDGISAQLGGGGEGMHALPLSLYLPPLLKLRRPLHSLPAKLAKESSKESYHDAPYTTIIKLIAGTVTVRYFLKAV
jgi:hypothetical protein